MAWEEIQIRICPKGTDPESFKNKKHLPSGAAIATVRARVFHLKSCPDIDFAVHRDHTDRKYWVATELATGLKVSERGEATARSQKQAIRLAAKNIRLNGGQAKVLAAIDAAVKAHGKELNY